jgi:uncharacterized protein
MISRRTLLSALAVTPFAAHAVPSAEPWAAKLIEAARAQVGVTLRYDPSYVTLKFPNGDVPREIGVCTDVVIRAYRDAFDFDLQSAVNADMRRNFSAYPKTWGLKRADSNIDHRRVPNLRTFLKRKGAEIEISSDGQAYQAGDLVTQNLPGNLPHIAIVSDTLNPSGTTSAAGRKLRIRCLRSKLPAVTGWRFSSRTSRQDKRPRFLSA